MRWVIIALATLIVFLWMMKSQMAKKPVARLEKHRALVKTKRSVTVEGRRRDIICFVLESGDEEALEVDAHSFDKIKEGQKGMLSFEDTRFIAFSSEDLA